MGAVPEALGAAGLAKGVSELLKTATEHLLNPEMFRALSPTEGFEAKPHTFQAIETEGRWKKDPDWQVGDQRYLAPPGKKVGQIKMFRATILTIEMKPINAQLLQSALELSVVSALPAPILGTVLSSLAGRSIPVSTESAQGRPNADEMVDQVLELFNQIVKRLLPPAQLMTTAMQPRNLVNLSQFDVPRLKDAVALILQTFPAAVRALADLQPVSSSAEIEAVWWSDGFEICAGQAASKHVRGFGSLFGNQARVELDGVSYGNYYPMSYCLTFTGVANPLGPTFEEFKGMVKLDAEGTVTGLFCERSNRDKKDPDTVPFSGKDKGYVFAY